MVSCCQNDVQMWRVLEMDSVVSIIVPVYNVKDYLDI